MGRLRGLHDSTHLVSGSPRLATLPPNSDEAPGGRDGIDENRSVVNRRGRSLTEAGK